MLPALVALLLLAAPAAAQAPRDPEVLRAVLEAQFAAANAKDVDAYVVTLHQDSPYFYQEIRQFQEVIAPLGLTMRLEAVNFTAFDGRHAYARAVQDVLGPEGSEHVDTRFDVLYVFRDDAGAWKTYLAVVLDSHPVPPTTGADQMPVDARRDYPLFADVADWFMMQVVDCSRAEVPSLGADARVCLGPSLDGMSPTDDDEVLPTSLEVMREAGPWSPVGGGLRLEFTSDGVRYVYTYTHDGYSVIDAFR